MNGDHRQKPGSPGDILAHHGVKGMKWGVRKSDVTSARDAAGKIELNSITKSYMASAAKMASEQITPEKAAANLAANRERFNQKFEASEAPGVKLQPAEKLPVQETPKLSRADKIQIGLALGAVGGALAYGAYASRFQLDPKDMLDMSGANAGPGEKIGLGTFFQRIDASQKASWTTDGFFRPESFARPEFELPAGQVFKRISSAPESTFSSATYCTADPDDHNRYAVALGVSGIKRHQISFQSTAPVRVPALTSVLETIREDRARAHGVPTGSITDDEVLVHYKNISHAQWKDGASLKLIDSLKKKGYGAIVDEMDSGVFSDRPLVLFQKESMTPKKSTVLKKKDLRQAKAALKEVNQPPGRKLPGNNQAPLKVANQADPLAGLLDQFFPAA